MAFLTMAFSQLVHSFNMRSREESVFAFAKNPNSKLVLAFLVCALLQLVVVFVPFLRELFDTALLQTQDWLIVLALSLSPMLVVEIIKLIKRMNKKVLTSDNA